MRAVKVVTQHRVNPSKLLLLKLHFDYLNNRLTNKQRETYFALKRTHYPIQHGHPARIKTPPLKSISVQDQVQINTEMSTLWN